MAGRLTGRSRALVPGLLSPERRSIIAGHLRRPDEVVEDVPCDAGSGALDLARSTRALSDDVACVYSRTRRSSARSSRDSAAIAERAHARGALAVVGVDATRSACSRRRRATAPTSSAASCRASASTCTTAAARSASSPAPTTSGSSPSTRRSSSGAGRTVDDEWGFGEVRWDRMSYVQRGEARDFTGTTQCLWAIGVGRLPRAPRPGRDARARHDDHAAQPVRGEAPRRASGRRARPRSPRRSSRSSSSTSTAPARPSPRSTAPSPRRASTARSTSRARSRTLGQSALVLRHRGAHPGRHRPARGRPRGGHRVGAGMDTTTRLRPSTRRLERAAPARADEPGRARPRPAPGRAGHRSPRSATASRRFRRRCAARPRPALPGAVAAAVLRHFLRLSQETFGQDVDVHLGLGTCTMKYSPKVNEALVRSHKVTRHAPVAGRRDRAGDPRGDLSLRADHLRDLRAWTAPRSSPAAARRRSTRTRAMIAAYQAARGQGRARRDHHDGLLAPLRRRRTGDRRLQARHALPGRRTACRRLEALEAALSERTAGLMITNPEDTGIFNPQIDAHGRARPRRPAASATTTRRTRTASSASRGPRRRLRPLPVQPAQDVRVAALLDGNAGRRLGGLGRARAVSCRPRPSSSTASAIALDYDRPHSIGKVRAFHGVPATVVRSYAWVLALGAEGLREVAEIAVLNNNYLAKRLEGVRGLDVSYAEGNAARRLEQIRYSWRQLTRGDGRRHARPRSPHERLRRRPVLPEPRAVGGRRSR